MANQREALGMRLAKLRGKAGLTQQDLADRCGIALNSLQNWEQGRAEPGILYAQPLAQALGISTDHLLDLAEELAQEAPAKKGRGRPKKSTS